MLWKLPKYTRPHLRVAHNMSLAATDISQSWPNFVKHVLEQIRAHTKSNNIHIETYLHASHMLTKIAYQAFGMIDELPAPLTQATMPKHSTRARKGKARAEEGILIPWATPTLEAQTSLKISK